jgi:hypothetical protein
MSEPTIHGNRPVFSASAVLEAIGSDLAKIKADDRLTWADVGAALGVSEDQAAKYADGTATMNLVTFARGWREWNGRFAGGLARLVTQSRPSNDADRARESKVLKAALALSVALADDDTITPDEVRANRATIEAARDALDELLRKLVRAA